MVDTIDLDLKLSEGKSGEFYAQAVERVYSVIIDRIHDVSGGETKAYLREAFERYLPGPDDNIWRSGLIEFQSQLFVRNLLRNGLSIRPELVKSFLGRMCIMVQPKIDAIGDAYAHGFQEYCRNGFA